MNEYPPGWTELPAAGLWARPFRTPRPDAAFWKHLYESFEHVALIRTAANDGEEAILVIIAPADFVLEAQAILDDVVAYGSPPVGPAVLPDACREDWFLAEWAKP
jgi:hypothetical protein